jgi:F420-dependent methylenetetrahydromethanopterin dehydrogenase
MRQTILELTEKVAQLTVKVEFMQKENAELMSTMAKRNS